MMQSEAPRRPVREPVFNLPGAVLAMLLALGAIHLLRTLVLADETDLELLLDLAVIPARWTLALDASRAAEILSAAGEEESLRSALANYVVTGGGAHPWTGLSYAFLHGSWTRASPGRRISGASWRACCSCPPSTGCYRSRILKDLRDLSAARTSPTIAGRAERSRSQP